MSNLGLSLYQLQTQKQMQDEVVRKQQDWDREKFYADLAVKRLEEDRKIANAEHLRRLKLAEAYGRMAGIRGDEPPSYEDQKLKDAARLHTELVPAELSLMEMQQGIKQAWRPASYAASQQRVDTQQFGSMNRKVLDIESKEKIAADYLNHKNKVLQLQREKLAWEKDLTNNPDNLRKKSELDGREGELRKEFASLILRQASTEAEAGTALNAVDPDLQQYRSSQLGSIAVMVMHGAMSLEDAQTAMDNLPGVPQPMGGGAPSPSGRPRITDR